MITLVHLRLAIAHAALAIAYQVDRDTVTRAVTQVRPLLARRGHATAAGTRLHTLADVFAYAAAEGVTLRIDATEIRVRRPRKDAQAARHSSPADSNGTPSRPPSQRIAVEHTIAELKWWRDLPPETINAVAGLVSDRSPA